MKWVKIILIPALLIGCAIGGGLAFASRNYNAVKHIDTNLGTVADLSKIKLTENNPVIPSTPPPAPVTQPTTHTPAKPVDDIGYLKSQACISVMEQETQTTLDLYSFYNNQALDKEKSELYALTHPYSPGWQDTYQAFRTRVEDEAYQTTSDLYNKTFASETRGGCGVSVPPPHHL